MQLRKCERNGVCATFWINNQHIHFSLVIFEYDRHFLPKYFLVAPAVVSICIVLFILRPMSHNPIPLYLNPQCWIGLEYSLQRATWPITRTNIQFTRLAVTDRKTKWLWLFCIVYFDRVSDMNSSYINWPVGATTMRIFGSVLL